MGGRSMLAAAVVNLRKVTSKHIIRECSSDTPLPNLKPYQFYGNISSAMLKSGLAHHALIQSTKYPEIS